MKLNEMTIAQRLTTVYEKIRLAEQQYGRKPGSVQLLAVSKTRPIRDIQEAQHAGQTAFGENYLQEALGKITALATPEANTPPHMPHQWHFIGPIQSNKTRDIAEHFNWVHSLERIKIAQRLSEQRPKHLPPLSVCLQINIDNETSKSGLLPSDALLLAQQIQELPQLKLRGLMAIPTPTTNFNLQRQSFRKLRELYEQLQQQEIPLDTLSMGMSNDLQAAIAEGATLVRIGTAIFGPRVKSAQ